MAARTLWEVWLSLPANLYMPPYKYKDVHEAVAIRRVICIEYDIYKLQMYMDIIDIYYIYFIYIYIIYLYVIANIYRLPYGKFISRYITTC